MYLPLPSMEQAKKYDVLVADASIASTTMFASSFLGLRI